MNCPFDAGYQPSFQAIIFSIFACGFRPRSALELDDAGYARLDKILTIIGECRYGIHDISRTELDPHNQLPRFNMPFELGLFMAARRFGDDEQARKKTLVLDREQYRYQQFLSDLSGMDISAHHGDPEEVAGAVRNWLVSVSRRRIAADQIIIAAYTKFSGEWPRLATLRGFDPATIPYVDFEFLVTEWLLSEQLGD